jgi:hypothetical protein
LRGKNNTKNAVPFFENLVNYANSTIALAWRLVAWRPVSIWMDGALINKYNISK